MAANSARIYKVSHDSQGNRPTWLKVTGGEFKAKTMLSGTARAGSDPGESKIGDDGLRHEKADHARVFRREVQYGRLLLRAPCAPLRA